MTNQALDRAAALAEKSYDALLKTMLQGLVQDELAKERAEAMAIALNCLGRAVQLVKGIPQAAEVPQPPKKRKKKKRHPTGQFPIQRTENGEPHLDEPTLEHVANRVQP